MKKVVHVRGRGGVWRAAAATARETRPREERQSNVCRPQRVTSGLNEGEAEQNKTIPLPASDTAKVNNWGEEGPGVQRGFLPFILRLRGPIPKRRIVPA